MVCIEDEYGKRWYKDNACTIPHREDGPAKELYSGTTAWYRDGLKHRLDGPAVIRQDGYQAWYQEGVLHRTDGPAIINEKGIHKWFYWGKKIPVDNQKDFDRYIKIMVFE